MEETGIRRCPRILVGRPLVCIGFLQQTLFEKQVLWKHFSRCSGRVFYPGLETPILGHAEELGDTGAECALLNYFPVYSLVGLKWQCWFVVYPHAPTD